MLRQKIKAFSEKIDRQTVTPLLLAGLFGILILYTLIQTGSFFYEQFQSTSLLEKQTVTPLQSANVEALQDISATAANIHLFGRAVSNSNDIPLSALNLKLTGIFFGNSEKDSKVSVIYNEQEEKLYSLNDTLPNGVVIERIFPGEVIIKYNGQLQKLVLFQQDQ